MASQRPPGRGNFPPRGPRPTSGHAGTRRPRPATGGSSSSERPGPQARREAQPSRPKTNSPRKPRPAQGDPGADRLQKILAHAGVGSRRVCEEMILQGRITVGGQIIRELGTKVDLAKTSVAVDGQKIHQERLVYFAVNKPKGYVSTNNDPSGRPRVLDLMPEISQRVYTVGRLDEMSVGLMLLTNDGELANKLAHPRFGVEKLYRVIVAGTPERETLNQLTDGIWLAEGKVRAKRVRAVAKKGDATILEMVLAEGKNREVRRMLAKLGHKVMMLTRVAVGPITLKGLPVGQFRPLTGREVDLLQRVAAGEPVPMPWATDRRPPRPDADRPRRPIGAGNGPTSQRESRDDREGVRTGGPPARSRGGDRPHGPGYRGDDAPLFQDRPSGPPPQRSPNRESDRRPGGRPGRPGMFQARPDDGDIRPREDRRPPPQNRSGSGPRPGGPRPYNDGPPQGSRSGPRPGGPRPYGDGPRQESRGGPRQDGPRPGGSRPSSNGPRQDRPRQDGPRPYGDGPRQESRVGPRQDGPRPYNDGPRQESRGGPRQDGPRQDGPRPGGPRPYNDGPRQESRGGPRQDGPRQDRPRQDGPRPYGDGPQQESRGGPRQDGPRPGGPRPYNDGPQQGARGEPRPGGPSGGRPQNAGQGDNRRDQSSDGPRRPGGDDRRQNDRRPPLSGRRLPIPGSSEPSRKVIGMNSGPSPVPSQETNNDRPKPRMKRPAPRGGAPGKSRLIRKPRPGQSDD